MDFSLIYCLLPRYRHVLKDKSKLVPIAKRINLPTNRRLLVGAEIANSSCPLSLKTIGSIDFFGQKLKQFPFKIFQWEF